MKTLIDKLDTEHFLERSELISLLRALNEESDSDIKEYLRQKAHATRVRVYGNKVFLRGMIEFTSYCRNDCYYCGIRRENQKAERYRLSLGQILDCCQTGYELGYRTFLLQGGEDAYFTDDRIVEMVRAIRMNFPDCAITLSIGEGSFEAYQKYYNAGADRYLLRHETAVESHYAMLHPKELNLQNRKRCLYDLKKIGYQVGAGFMVGSPFQTLENIAEDILFLKELEPHMVGLGPFIPHKDTQFRGEKQGSLEMTIQLISLTRLMLPKALIAATTALGTIHPKGREMGLKAGANVVMPNLSPTDVRTKYLLYDNKICTGEEAAECRFCIQNRIEAAGFNADLSRGDPIEYRNI